jgi:hypothetical protein
MTQDDSYADNNLEFRRMMLAGALSMSPELAAACDKFETATDEELEAALAPDDQRSVRSNHQTEPVLTIGAPERTPLMTIATHAAALAASAVDVAPPTLVPETIIVVPYFGAENGALESRTDCGGELAQTTGPALAKTGMAASELRDAVSAEVRSQERFRFARAMSLLRSRLASPGAALPSR